MVKIKIICSLLFFRLMRNRTWNYNFDFLDINLVSAWKKSSDVNLLYSSSTSSTNANSKSILSNLFTKRLLIIKEARGNWAYSLILGHNFESNSVLGMTSDTKLNRSASWAVSLWFSSNTSDALLVPSTLGNVYEAQPSTQMPNCENGVKKYAWNSFQFIKKTTIFFFNQSRKRTHRIRSVDDIAQNSCGRGDADARPIYNTNQQLRECNERSNKIL